MGLLVTGDWEIEYEIRPQADGQSFFSTTDLAGRRFELTFYAFSRIFDLKIFAAIGSDNDVADEASKMAPIFEKKFNYVLVDGIEDALGGYTLEYRDKTENISGWLFEETVEFFFPIAGVYSVAMS